jgi:hypothetical protein
VRLTTWNCYRGTRIPDALTHLEGIGADLITLQECQRPVDEDPNVLWCGTDPNQGIAVVNRNAALQMERLNLPNLHPTILPVLVHGPTPFVFVAVWTHPPYATVASAAMAACAAGSEGLPMVAAGDFNISPGVVGQERSAPEFLRKMREEVGLVSAYHAHFAVAPRQEAHPTYLHQWRQETPFHFDYVFVPDAWVERIRGVEVGGYSDWKQSDHRPLTVHVEM